MRNFKFVTVNAKAEKSIRSGHPWVYGEEVTERTENIENGELTDVFSQKGRYLGTGFYNSNSKILVRIFTDNPNDTFDYEYYKRRVRYSVDYRITVMKEDFSSCRLIFGDSDGFPGFIADKFEDIVVCQIMCLGIERIKDMLYKAIREVLEEFGYEVRTLIERNDVKVRAKEGLELYKGEYVFPGEQPSGISTTVITENGIKYHVDCLNGQKTGFFLDQKYNRKAAAGLAENRKVLDCFTHTGAFALNCAAAGAKSVTAVDISAEAVNTAKSNAELNGLKNTDVICADVFDYLDMLYNEKKYIYDYIILDPPAFTKSRETVNAAYRGYKEINLKAMRILPRGAYLATCSCSHFMNDALFRKMLEEAAADAKKKLRIIEYRQQAADHPVMLGIPETEYLNFYLIQVV